MIKNVLQLLECCTKEQLLKDAIVEKDRAFNYLELISQAKSLGTFLYNKKGSGQPIAILMDKGISNVVAMLAVIYSGNYYTILDVKMPKARMQLITDTLKPELIIHDNKNAVLAKTLSYNECVTFEEGSMCIVEQDKLDLIRGKAIDTDPIYALFTSGSTGIPKGTVIAHRSVIDYAYWVCETFDINDQSIFGNQTDFYFSMSVLDLYASFCAKATLCIIPKPFFSFPVKLIEFLNEKKVNTIYWVPSALSIVADLKTLDAIKPQYIEKILFAGEVMPMKQLNVWRKHLPKVLYANLYGPTEITDICTYYIVNRQFDDHESLPIGKPCNNCDVIILNEKNCEVQGDEVGELCVRGSFLALGYYDNAEKSREVFVQNPLNKHYEELIYRTGDLVKYNEFNEIIYISRKDQQIKHMGYRIELGEIEAGVQSLDGVIRCACIYDNAKKHIVLFYEGANLEDKAILQQCKNKLPNYMIPNKIISSKIGLNANGKIDRIVLKEKYIEEN